MSATIITETEVRQAREYAAERSIIESIHPDQLGQMLHRLGECECTFTDVELEMAVDAKLDDEDLASIHPDTLGRMMHRHGECGCSQRHAA